MVKVGRTRETENGKKIEKSIRITIDLSSEGEILKEDRRTAGVGGRLRFVRVKGGSSIEERRKTRDAREGKGLAWLGALGHTDTASRSLARSLLLSLAIRPDL